MQSPLSWQQKGQSGRFVADQQEEFVFQEVQVEETFVIV